MPTTPCRLPPTTPGTVGAGVATDVISAGTPKEPTMNRAQKITALAIPGILVLFGLLGFALSRLGDAASPQRPGHRAEDSVAGLRHRRAGRRRPHPPDRHLRRGASLRHRQHRRNRLCPRPAGHSPVGSRPNGLDPSTRRHAHRHLGRLRGIVDLPPRRRPGPDRHRIKLNRPVSQQCGHKGTRIPGNNRRPLWIRHTTAGRLPE